MSLLQSRAVRATVLAAVVVPLTASLAACGKASPISGAPAAADAATSAAVAGTFSGQGATSQEKAMDAWIQGFIAQNPAARVTYDGVGSGAGRESFLGGQATFGTSDVPLSDDEMAASSKACDGGNALDLPVYISPIVVAFNLPGVKTLNLSSATVAGLFSGKIRSWNDSAVADDNPGVALPDVKVVPVHRSDSSGTTQNFTDWLHATAPDAWDDEASSDWPRSTGSSAEGTGGVVGLAKSTPGAVTYADASASGGLGKASIRVGDQWVAASAAGAAGAVALSPRNESRYADDLSYDLDRTTTNPHAYPLVLVSYLLACSRYADEAKGQFVKSLITWIASDEGQQAGTAAAGSAPLTPAQQDWLRTAAQDVFLVPTAS